MTTLMYIDPPTSTETRVQAVARRLRMELARVGISPTAAARTLGMSQPSGMAPRELIFMKVFVPHWASVLRKS